ncbi:MAG TPA: response regulator [Terriglobales bacterium]|jgi:CheY-like chemotaxis protein|nr:response regulator [Terriglobales bacterium]
MKTTVLLIDDSRFLRKANELALARSGYSVLAAGDGEEGLHIACEKVPDLIVLDMMLPKMPGQQLLHELKNDPRTSGIPVIVLSSLPKSNAERLRNEGAVAYFEKASLGIDQGSSKLIEAIGNVLSSNRSAVAAAAKFSN